MRRLKHTIVLASAVIASSASAQTKPYAVPLKMDYRISGSYAELRGNHFHAGLDMGTAGVENVDVHSAEDGWVSRVKVGPYGYGRALYIDHPDGHTTVYGHLNGFVAKIDSAVRAEQYAKESFSIDLFLEKDAIRVRRDEVVAYSGNTGGSGGPHLHFEVRDTKTEEPLNPLRFIPTAKDVTAPTLFGVKIYAMGDDAQVEGAEADKYYALQAISGKSINVCGEIGLGLHCTDYITQGGRPCGVTEIRLYDNDELVFHSNVTHFPFDLNRHVNSHIDFAERLTTKRFIQRSVVSPGNRLPIYDCHKTPTVVNDGETHHIRYEALDFAGNKSTLKFTLMGKRKATPTTKRTAKQGYHVDWRRTWTIDTLSVDILIPHDSFYDDEWITITQTTAKGRTAFKIGDESITMQKNATISLPIPKDMDGYGRKTFIGKWDGRNIAYVGGKIVPDERTERHERVEAETSTLGTFVVALDTIAPTVRMRNKANVIKKNDLISIGVSDDLTGIDTYDVYIDGQWEVFEFDYKNARLKATPAYLGLKAGRHTLKAVVADACGNQKQLTWEFTVAGK